MQMKREYVFMDPWLQYALLQLGYPLVTILAGCMVLSAVHDFGIGQQECGAGKII